MWCIPPPFPPSCRWAHCRSSVLKSRCPSWVMTRCSPADRRPNILAWPCAGNTHPCTNPTWHRHGPTARPTFSELESRSFCGASKKQLWCRYQGTPMARVYSKASECVAVCSQRVPTAIRNGSKVLLFFILFFPRTVKCRCVRISVCVQVLWGTFGGEDGAGEAAVWRGRCGA